MLGYTQADNTNHTETVMPFGTGELTSSTESVVVLFKGGRLQTWHTLTDAQRDDYSAHHVELMLGVAHEHGMMTLEGFKLLEPKQPWERFWVLEFPNLGGGRGMDRGRDGPAVRHVRTLRVPPGPAVR